MKHVTKHSIQPSTLCWFCKTLLFAKKTQWHKSWHSATAIQDVCHSQLLRGQHLRNVRLQMLYVMLFVQERIFAVSCGTTALTITKWQVRVTTTWRFVLRKDCYLECLLHSQVTMFQECYNLWGEVTVTVKLTKTSTERIKTTTQFTEPTTLSDWRKGAFKFNSWNWKGFWTQWTWGVWRTRKHYLNVNHWWFLNYSCTPCTRINSKKNK